MCRPPPLPGEAPVSLPVITTSRRATVVLSVVSIAPPARTEMLASKLVPVTSRTPLLSRPPPEPAVPVAVLSSTVESRRVRVPPSL